MPYREIWVPNELFVSHLNIDVYRLCMDDWESNGLSTYHYALSDDALIEEDDCGQFDVRKLSTWKRTVDSCTTYADILDRCKEAIINAILENEIKPLSSD